MTGGGSTDGLKKREKPQAGIHRAKVPPPSGRASKQSGGKPGAASHISLLRKLAHDLRNPISGILAASQCLLEDAALFLDRPHVTLLRAIESSSDLMLQLIEDMLEVAKADSERLRLRLRPTHITELIEKALVHQQGQAAARDLRLNLTMDAEIPKVEVDTPKLGWALNALLANTIRSCEPRGRIEVRITSQRKNVSIAVRYAGDGAAAQTTDANRSTGQRGRQQASSLTAATARLIVERHGGTIRMDRRAPPPAFTLTLPKFEARKPGGAPLKRAASGG